MSITIGNISAMTGKALTDGRRRFFVLVWVGRHFQALFEAPPTISGTSGNSYMLQPSSHSGPMPGQIFTDYVIFGHFNFVKRTTSQGFIPGDGF